MKFAAIIFLIVGPCLAVSAQTRKPSSPAHPFHIKTVKDLEGVTNELEKQTGNANKDIVPAKGVQMRVAIFHDSKREGDQYEVHDTSDDIYYVLDGKATLAIGGELVDATEISPGEWRAKTASGGNPFEIKKGDLIVIPRGTVHQRTVTGKGFSMILVKVFAAEQR
jgi:mannose-6-phosphate isomerase-like protein (cupin superfamily)